MFPKSFTCFVNQIERKNKLERERESEEYVKPSEFMSSFGHKRDEKFRQAIENKSN